MVNDVVIENEEPSYGWDDARVNPLERDSFLFPTSGEIIDSQKTVAEDIKNDLVMLKYEKITLDNILKKLMVNL